MLMKDNVQVLQALTAGRRVKEAELLQSQDEPHVDGNEQQGERERLRNRDKPEEQELDTMGQDWK